MAISPIYDRDGKLLQFIGIQRDVSTMVGSTMEDADDSSEDDVPGGVKAKDGAQQGDRAARAFASAPTTASEDVGHFKSGLRQWDLAEW